MTQAEAAALFYAMVTAPVLGPWWRNHANSGRPGSWNHSAVVYFNEKRKPVTHQWRWFVCTDPRGGTYAEGWAATQDEAEALVDAAAIGAGLHLVDALPGEPTTTCPMCGRSP